jgi:hypothetical protein
MQIRVLLLAPLWAFVLMFVFVLMIVLELVLVSEQEQAVDPTIAFQLLNESSTRVCVYLTNTLSIRGQDFELAFAFPFAFAAL